MIEDIIYEKEMAGKQCQTCFYRKNFGVLKLQAPCCHCLDRPGRGKDKSEYLKQFDDDPELQDKYRNEREGKYDY